MTQTRLIGRAGPPTVIALHFDYGFHMGNAGPVNVWSHDPKSLPIFHGGHPDRARTASSWGSELEAKEYLQKIITFYDWIMLSFVEMRADVFTSSPAEYSTYDTQPTWSCSIEACHKATGKFSPYPIHMLQENMIRR